MLQARRLSHGREPQASSCNRKALDDPSRYRRLVGLLIYLIITRPELCYLVHILSQIMQALLEEHMDAARRVLRYIKGIPGYGILLGTDCAIYKSMHIVMQTEVLVLSPNGLALFC